MKTETLKVDATKLEKLEKAIRNAAKVLDEFARRINEIDMAIAKAKVEK